MIFYTIWTNRSLTPNYIFRPTFEPGPKDKNLIQLKNSLDNAIIEYLHAKSPKANEKPPLIKGHYSDMPQPLDRIYQDWDLMGMYGSFYFILAPILTFM